MVSLFAVLFLLCSNGIQLVHAISPQPPLPTDDASASGIGMVLPQYIRRASGNRGSVQSRLEAAFQSVQDTIPASGLSHFHPGDGVNSSSIEEGGIGLDLLFLSKFRDHLRNTTAHCPRPQEAQSTCQGTESFWSKKPFCEKWWQPGRGLRLLVIAAGPVIALTAGRPAKCGRMDLASWTQGMGLTFHLVPFALLTMVGQASALFFQSSPFGCIPWPAAMRPVLSLWLGADLLSISRHPCWAKCALLGLTVSSWLLIAMGQALPPLALPLPLPLRRSHAPVAEAWCFSEAGIGGLALVAFTFDFSIMGREMVGPEATSWTLFRDVATYFVWLHGIAFLIFAVALYLNGPRVDESGIVPLVDLAFIMALRSVATRRRDGAHGPSVGPVLTGSPRHGAGDA